MITPNHLSRITAKSTNALNDVSEEIIKRLAKRLETTITKYGKNELIPTSLNEIYRLEEAGLAFQDIQQEIERALPYIQSEVREAFTDGAQLMDQYYGGNRSGTGVNNPSSPINTALSPALVNGPIAKPKKDKKKYNYPDFVATTGYGSMLGLCGINCRHTFSIFFPDSMDDTPDKPKEEDNKKRYALEQKARAMERAIREKKQQLAAFSGVSDDIGQSKRQTLVTQINDMIRDYQNFCRSNGLSMSEWRLATTSSVAAPRRYNSTAQSNISVDNMSDTMIKRLDNVFRRTNGSIRNICNTTASATQKSFIDACDKAFMQIQSGETMDNAIRTAISDMGAQGVSCVYFNSGRTDKIEVALARAIRTGVNQANAELTLAKCAELGVDYVKVSSHEGARVTNKNDYTNHSWWQGQVYKLNWDDEALADFKAEAEKAAEENADNGTDFAENVQNTPVNVQNTPITAQNYENNVIKSKVISNKDIEIIDNDKGLARRNSNTNTIFKSLTVPMTKKEVKKVVKRMGIDYNSIKLQIVRNTELLGTGYTGYTYDTGDKVQLYPDAFENIEQLVKTLAHERKHVEQVRKYGKAKNSKELKIYEDEAIAEEEKWWSWYKKKYVKEK